VVVVEFWATWCGPCVAAIPHLNKLAEEFRGQDVVFLAVTDDSEDRVKAFLDAQPTEAVIGIDAGRKTGKAFGAATIPHTVIVGKDGRVIGVTYPEHVTADVIREALAGKSPVFPLKGRGP
jgi:thiol-disulfide isomerase/thioredoxin